MAQGDVLVVVGTSVGGLRAMQTILGALPRWFRRPIVVAQHRSRDSGEGLSLVLQHTTHLKVADAEDKDPIVEGRVYLAPPDYHLLVEQGALALSTAAPVWHARPSIDVLFESAAEAYQSRVVGVALTGASPDGARGLRRIKELGGRTIVQDPAGAEGPVLPRAAIAAAVPDRVLPLQDIAAYLCTLAD